MRNLISIIIFTLFLTSCASVTTIPEKFAIQPQNQYIPINFQVNAGRYVSQNTADLAEYIYYAFEESNLFSKIERNIFRWPITLSIHYSWKKASETENFTSTMISAATLLLIPTYVDEVHSFNVEIISGKETIATLKYSETIETTLSLYHKPSEQRKAGINKLLKKLYSDLEKNKLLPKISDLNKKKQQKSLKYSL